MIEILRQARELVAALVDKQPTMLLYDIGHTEERSDEELLSDDLEAIKERLERIRTENAAEIKAIVDDIMDKYGFGGVLDHVEPYSIPLLGGDAKEMEWLGSTKNQDLFPSGVKFEWTPWEDRDGDGSNTFGLGTPTSTYAQWMTATCHYCPKRYQFGSELPFNQEFFACLVEMEGWVASPAGYHICPDCFLELFRD